MVLLVAIRPLWRQGNEIDKGNLSRQVASIKDGDDGKGVEERTKRVRIWANTLPDEATRKNEEHWRGIDVFRLSILLLGPDGT